MLRSDFNTLDALCKALHNTFKEAKQLLGLGKSKSTNFDVQIAQTTITMMQHLLIGMKYRVEAYETTSMYQV